ncbi:MAG TPA: EamA family transporter [Longimicrobiales bacterium]|nr:EamA family transporter [Longimicrobiales bacterium]
MWIALALLTAICTALRDVASKHATRRADPVAVALGVAAVPAVAIGAVVLARGLPALGPAFWTALAVSGGINALATPLLVLALQRSDLSLVAPVTSLTPLFMLATGAVVLGELPGPLGIAGVAVIVAGAYLLSVSEVRAGPLAPFRVLVRDPGARTMLVVAFLYSISAAYDKVGTGASDPLFWAAAIHAVTAGFLLPVAFLRARGTARRRRAVPSRGPRGAAPAILFAGIFTAIGAAAQMTALMMTLAAFVIAVKRTSTLFGVLLGHALFREENVRERLVGAAVMLAGFLMITLS